MEEAYNNLQTVISTQSQAQLETAIQDYLNAGGDINKVGVDKHSNKLTLLFQAILENRTFFVEKILEVPGIDVNAENIFGGKVYTALSYVVTRDSSNITDLLLSREDIDVNKPIIFPPLSRSVKALDLKSRNKLLAREDIDVHMENTPPENRIWAIMEDNFIVDPNGFELYLDKGVKMDLSSVLGQKIVLRFLFKSKDENKIKKVLARDDVDVNTMKVDGAFLLETVLDQSNVYLLKILVKDPRINTNLQLRNDEVPLMYRMYPLPTTTADNKFSLELIKILLSNPKTEVDAVDKKGNSTIMRLISKLKPGYPREYIKLITTSIFDIINAGGNPLLQNNEGQTIQELGEQMPDLVAEIVQKYTKIKNEK
jgi:hypothetical protein